MIKKSQLKSFGRALHCKLHSTGAVFSTEMHSANNIQANANCCFVNCHITFVFSLMALNVNLKGTIVTWTFCFNKVDGKLYGRGSTDDKGPVLCWLNCIEAHQKLGLEVPVNLKFCFEGMEESGSEGLDDLIMERLVYRHQIVVPATTK